MGDRRRKEKVGRMSLLRDPHVARAMDLVGRVYEASADVRQWPVFLKSFADATGSAGTVIWLHDFADASAVMGTNAMSIACDVGFETGYLDRYAEHFTFANPWMKSIDALPEGQCANSSEVYSDTDLRRLAEAAGAGPRARGTRAQAGLRGLDVQLPARGVPRAVRP
jgi:hypothetical protein